MISVTAATREDADRLIAGAATDLTQALGDAGIH
jgi:hypothetical protein